MVCKKCKKNTEAFLDKAKKLAEDNEDNEYILEKLDDILDELEKECKNLINN